MLNNRDLVQNIGISDYDYILNDEQIAKYPLAERDQSKLLVFRDGNISQSIFSSLPEILSDGQLLVFNSTRVIPARLKFRKSTGANIEIFCLEPVNPKDYQLSFQANRCTWKCIVGNLKKWKDTDLHKDIVTSSNTITVTATKIADYGTYQHIEFSWNTAQTFGEIIELLGVTPIPPYLNRITEDIDRDRYQTVYSRTKGSVAAPTAGLHFTNSLIDNLKKQNINIEEVTLHVGAGTFKPVQTEYIADHEMHTEFFSVSKQTINQLIINYGKIVAVGTTTLRTLESLYWIGIKLRGSEGTFKEQLHINQWDACNVDGNISYTEALQTILNYLENNNLNELVATTQILIAPGYNIRSIEALITNFHQPKSTLLLLIAAIVGNKWKHIYNYAAENNFRFLSYGDSSILYLRKKEAEKL